jgi:hypothetical protein
MNRGNFRKQDRYKRHTAGEARDIYEAVANPEKGMLEWIKQHW